jgi:hypothetical protein
MLAALYFLDQALVTTDDARGIWTVTTEYQMSNLKYRTPRGKGLRLGHVTISSPTINAWLSGFFFVLALSTKEDISLHVFMIGLYLLVLLRRWQPGLVLIIVGLAWFYISFYVIIPASRPTGAGSAYVGFFDTLGDTPLDIALAPIRDPRKVTALLVTPENTQALKMLTLPLAFLPLVGLPVFILAAPTLAITLLSSNPLMHQLETYHYAAPAIPFVILAAVDGIARLSNIGALRPNGASRHRKSLGDSPVTDPSSETGGQPLTSSLLLPTILLSLLVLLFSLGYHFYRGYSPLARSFHWPMVTDHQRLGDEIASSIPSLAPVIAQAELVTLASHRPWIQIWQGPFDERADYYLLDISHPAFVNRDGAQERLLSDMAQDPTVGPIATQDGYLLIQRDAPRSPTTPEFFTFAYADPPASAIAVAATFGDELQLVAVETHRNYADREAELLMTLYWRVLSPIEEDYFVAIFLLDETGNPVGVTRFQQPLTVWWPTSRWESEHTVRMLANTFPWWTGDRHRFGYGIAVVRGDEPWDVASRLPITRDDGGPVAVDDGTLLPLLDLKRVAGIPYETKPETKADAEGRGGR